MDIRTQLSTWNERNPELAAGYRCGQEPAPKARPATVSTDTIDAAAHAERFADLRNLRGVVFETEAPAEEEAAAMSFLTGAPAPAASGTEEINGFQVKIVGSGLISAAQATWITDILVKREVPKPVADSTIVRLEQGLAKYAGSQFIDAWRKAPLKATVVTGQVLDAAIKAGRYALVTEGVTKFYVVSIGKGNWAGRVFVNAQASDEQYPIRNASERNRIIKEINANPLEAQVRYGVEIGRCYACGRTLTDETSRSLGIGPDCRTK